MSDGLSAIGEAYRRHMPTGRPFVLGAIGTRLMLSFAGIIVITLALAGTSFVYLLQPYQTRQGLNRLGTLALPLSGQVRMLETQGSTPAQIGEFLDDQGRELGVRILLINQNTREVAHDTGRTLEGYNIVLEGERRATMSWIIEGSVDVPGEGILAIVLVGPGLNAPPERFPRFAQPNTRQFTVAMAIPQAGLGTEWREILPHLGGAALISLIASACVALFIARSISRPVAAVTRAAEGMARGDYNQQIQVRGHDEVARLAATFNVMAEQVSKSTQTLKAFLADVSHELRTPLTTIQGFSQAILDGTASNKEAIAESARIISEDAARMEHLVEDLLELSKIESGQIQLDKRPVDLREIVHGTIARAARRAPDRRIVVNLPSEPQIVDVDSRRIEQVLDNMVTNAVKHTGDAEQITVSSTHQGNLVALRVHNTGSFIREADRERIFERFAHGSGDGTGAGLGLAIAAEITRQHGGRIDLESSPTSGTTFTVLLPTALLPSRHREVNGTANR
ncbi:MAG TPA: HAMP domain-containing sensor histidine kinase [Rhodothermia bacterium]